MFTKPSILIYPDPSKPYYLLTDASTDCWEVPLYQHTSDSDTSDDLKAITLEKFLNGKTENNEVKNWCI